MTRHSRIKAIYIDSPPIGEVESTDSCPVIEKYLTDEACGLKGSAQRIFFPKNENEVSSILKWANETKTPVTVSGGGTGITGSRVPLGGVIMSMEKMINARENDDLKDWQVKFDSAAGKASLYIDNENERITVPPGITLDDLYSMLSERNMFYPPNPTELSAFVGGNISTNASGGRSFRNGAIRNWIKRLRIILPTGELLEIRRGEVFADNGRFQVEYPDSRVVEVPVPSYKMPLVKNASG